jgi:hypothetical protein
MWKCPKCHSSQLSVRVSVSAILHQTPGNFETEVEGGDHEWDEDSSMCCMNGPCYYVGPAAFFMVRKTMNFSYTFTGTVAIDDLDETWAAATLTAHLQEIGHSAVAGRKVTGSTFMVLDDWAGVVSIQQSVQEMVE